MLGIRAAVAAAGPRSLRLARYRRRCAGAGGQGYSAAGRGGLAREPVGRASASASAIHLAAHVLVPARELADAAGGSDPERRQCGAVDPRLSVAAYGGRTGDRLGDAAADWSGGRGGESSRHRERRSTGGTAMIQQGQAQIPVAGAAPVWQASGLFGPLGFAAAASIFFALWIT